MSHLVRHVASWFKKTDRRFFIFLGALPPTIGVPFLYYSVYKDQTPTSRERKALIKRRLLERQGVVFPHDPSLELPPEGPLRPSTGTS